MNVQATNGRAAAEQRRERLRLLMDRLEAALAEPPAAGLHDWRARLSDLGDELALEWRTHVADTEGEGGLFEEVVGSAPRLAPAVDRVRGEHPTLDAQLARFRDAVESDGSPDVVRSTGLTLLTALIAHRQHGADLLYEAYWVDVGGLSG